MKKNNKGFFLAETIVVIALVTTVMAFVYPNVTKLYENYKNRANYYDQTEDLYALRAVYNLFENDTINFVDPPGNIDANNVKSVSILGFLTFEGKNYSSGSGSSSAGCLRIDGLNKIYGPESKENYTDTTNLIGIGTGLDVIRSNNGGIIQNDYFTCFGDFYGLYGSYNLDTSGSAGLICNTTKQKYNNFFEKIKLKELYITGYMSNPSSDNYNFNKYLKRLKKTNYDSAAYRLIGVFEEGTEIRYASIKVDNPNPNRNCNLGG